MTSYTPTAEQQHALDLFATGESLAIEAGAGTGKTSTLLLLAHSTKRRGQYIAFNKAIVAEAGEKFPGTVNCSTAHSLAWRACGHPFADRMRNGKRMRSIEIANRLKIDAIRVKTFDGETKLLSQTFLAGLAMRAITRFCQTADPEPTLWHVPYVEGLDSANADGTGHRRYVVNKQVAKHIESALKLAWVDLTDTEGGLPFTTSTAMSVVLKLWQLSNPKIGADYILFDEAQDANPVMVAVVAAQTHSQLVWVGDSQQQIYGFTGAVNALSNVPAENRAYLTQSFRFGPAIADVANSMLDKLNAELRLTGTDTIASVVCPVADPDAILCRTNASAVRTVLEALRNEKTVHLVGGGNDIVSFTKAARDLMSGVRTDHPELACFESWLEVQDYVAQDEQGGDLRLLVSLIDEFGVETILEALDRTIAEKDADLVVSTAHKAKGREWNTVQLAADFTEEKAQQEEEMRLLYVAVTRARRELDIEALPFLRDGYTPTVRPVVVTADDDTEVEVAPVEVVAAKKSGHVGTKGQTIEAVVTVENSIGMTTKFGATNLTSLVDEDGNRFKAFLKEALTVGQTYEISAKVKDHGEFGGEKETTINYVDVVQEVTV